MKRYPTKTTRERVFATMDFRPRLNPGVTIQSVLNTEVVAKAGSDDNAPAVLDGPPVIVGTMVGQWLVGGVDGVVYILSHQALATDGSRPEGQVELPVRRYA